MTTLGLIRQGACRFLGPYDGLKRLELDSDDPAVELGFANLLVVAELSRILAVLLEGLE